MPSLPPRPGPPRAVLHEYWDRLLAWLQWFGPGRVLATSFSLVALVVAGFWILRAPPPGGPAAPGTTTGPFPVSSAPRAVPVFTLAPLSPAADAATDTAGTAPAVVVVHVAGAVRRPGVHELAPGARVVAALDAAGGPTDDAVLDRLNLAAPVVDGQWIHVPVEGEEPLVAVPAPGGSPGDAPGQHPTSPRATLPPAPVDVNTAGVDELQVLPGVGPVTAAAIVSDRERHGPFGSVDDLLRVRGIGPAKLEALRDRVRT